ELRGALAVRRARAAGVRARVADRLGRIRRAIGARRALDARSTDAHRCASGARRAHRRTVGVPSSVRHLGKQAPPDAVRIEIADAAALTVRGAIAARYATSVALRVWVEV